MSSFCNAVGLPMINRMMVSRVLEDMYKEHIASITGTLEVAQTPYVVSVGSTQFTLKLLLQNTADG